MHAPATYERHLAGFSNARESAKGVSKAWARVAEERVYNAHITQKWKRLIIRAHRSRCAQPVFRSSPAGAASSRKNILGASKKRESHDTSAPT